MPYLQFPIDFKSGVHLCPALMFHYLPHILHVWAFLCPVQICQSLLFETLVVSMFLVYRVSDLHIELIASLVAITGSRYGLCNCKRALPASAYVHKLHCCTAFSNFLPRYWQAAVDAGLSVSLQQGQAEDLPFEPGSFDAVIITLVSCCSTWQAHFATECS